MIVPERLEAYLQYLIDLTYTETESLESVSEAFMVACLAVLRYRSSGLHRPHDLHHAGLEWCCFEHMASDD